VCARFNGGANAGHTVVADGHKYAFHFLPCGILFPQCVNLLGNGVVVHVQGMFDELKQLDENGIDYKGRLKLCSRAQLVSNIQIEADRQSEIRRGNDLIGTTLKGIGPTYASKALRFGIRVGDLHDWDHFVLKYNEFIDKFSYQFHIENWDR